MYKKIFIFLACLSIIWCSNNNETSIEKEVDKKEKTVILKDIKEESIVSNSKVEEKGKWSLWNSWIVNIEGVFKK